MKIVSVPVEGKAYGSPVNFDVSPWSAMFRPLAGQAPALRWSDAGLIVPDSSLAVGLGAVPTVAASAWFKPYVKAYVTAGDYLTDSLAATLHRDPWLRQRRGWIRSWWRCCWCISSRLSSAPRTKPETGCSATYQRAWQWRLSPTDEASSAGVVAGRALSRGRRQPAVAISATGGGDRTRLARNPTWSDT